MYLHSVFAAGLYQQDLDDFQWNIWPWMRLDVDTISSNLDLVDPQQGYLIRLYLNPHHPVNC